MKKKRLQNFDVSPYLNELQEENVSRRLWNKDASLWKSDPKVRMSIKNRLGWLDLPTSMEAELGTILSFAQEARSEGVQDVVLLGMGGSSLCPEVLRRTFGTKPGYVRLHVLDTTDPGAIAVVDGKIDLKSTWFLMASKSGGTIEVVSLFDYFWERLKKAGLRAGRHFAAITDRGTPLEKRAKDLGFRKTFISPADVGGRFAALTPFGLVPAALLGIDVAQMLARGKEMADTCGPDVPVEDNPGLRLGAWMAAGREAGRDKVTFLISPGVAGFGLWVEQLIAESTGKEGTGILPVDAEPEIPSPREASDRLFVYMKLASSKDSGVEKKLMGLEKAGHPVLRLNLADKFDLGGEFFRWQMATAVAGQIMGVNPFDEPNVSESKANTLKVLGEFERVGRLPETAAVLTEKNIKAWRYPAGSKVKTSSIPALLKGFFAQAKRGDYVALMAYVSPSEKNHAALQKWRAKMGKVTGLPMTLGYGPRFLHSTGQLHKGGGNNGLFVQITADDAKDLSIPGAPYGFGTLKQAQALGDIWALKDHQRRTLRLHLSSNIVADLSRLSAGLGR